MLAADPADTAAYLERAQLYRAKGAVEEAEEDLGIVERLRPHSREAELVRAQLWRDGGRLEAARDLLDGTIARWPTWDEARELRGEIRAALGDLPHAIADFDTAIAFSRRPNPDHYLTRARWNAGLVPPDDDRLLAGLDEGIERLHAPPALVSFAIDIEVRAGWFDRALARVDEMLAQAPGKATWLARRGDILDAAGRSLEASASYTEALAALDALPPARRAAPASAALAARLRDQLRVPDDSGGADPRAGAAR